MRKAGSRCSARVFGSPARAPRSSRLAENRQHGHPTSVPLLRARFHFRVRGLLIEPHLLGTSHELSRDNRPVSIVFPSHEADLDQEALAEAELLKPDLFPPDDRPPTPPSARVTTSVRLQRSEPLARVDVIRVDVTTNSAISAADFNGREGKKSTHIDDALALLNELSEIALETVGGLVEGARVLGRQQWLGLGGEAPAGLGEAELVDLEANQVLPVWLGLRPGLVLNRIQNDQILDASSLKDLLQSVTEGKTPSLPEILLADAAYYAVYAAPTDLPRALLSAAVACEVKIKFTLRELVRPDGELLLELLLSNPRDYSMAAASLLDKAAKAVTGRSLREEDPKLFKRVEALFSRRNALAHRGQLPSEESALDSVRAAGEAFRWLRSLVRVE
jgi:hypothetical protein